MSIKDAFAQLNEQQLAVVRSVVGVRIRGLANDLAEAGMPGAAIPRYMMTVTQQRFDELAEIFAILTRE